MQASVITGRPGSQVPPCRGREAGRGQEQPCQSGALAWAQGPRAEKKMLLGQCWGPGEEGPGSAEVVLRGLGPWPAAWASWSPWREINQSSDGWGRASGGQAEVAPTPSGGRTEQLGPDSLGRSPGSSPWPWASYFTSRTCFLIRTTRQCSRHLPHRVPSDRIGHHA